MPTLDLRLTLVSPAFTYGAYQRGNYKQGDIRPELRAQSVRGQLRYWHRAIAGAQNRSLSKLWERESDVFGSTSQASAVSVRLYPRSPLEVNEREAMLPHREYSGGNQSTQAALDIDQYFDLQLVSRPGLNIPEDARNALAVWSLLGGIGKRSRRMFGAIRISSQDEAWYRQPADADALALLVRDTLSYVVGDPASLSGPPEWPTLHPAHSWVVVCKEGHETYKQANQALFGLLRGKFRSDADSFGYTSGGRRASPLHAQVRRINNTYYPVLTAMRSGSTDRRVKWDVVAKFMKQAETDFSGQTVWGGW